MGAEQEGRLLDLALVGVINCPLMSSPLQKWLLNPMQQEEGIWDEGKIQLIERLLLLIE